VSLLTNSIPEIQSKSVLIGGRYLLKEELMKCRFSTLHRAKDEVTNLPLVLRKLDGAHKHLKSGDKAPYHREARLQILREGRTLEKLRHRNLPRLRGVVEAGPDIYLLLEDMPGITLQEHLEKEDRLDWELLRRYLNQFLAVVEYLHSQPTPIIHRDLRPDTVLVTPFGVIKVGEFGLAKMNLEEGNSKAQTAFRNNGDPFFASPEQLMGESSHPRHDLYAVGAILYYLATGEKPPNALARMGGNDSVKPIKEIRPDAPDEFSAVVHRLLDPDPLQRPDSVAAVRALLPDFSHETRLPQCIMEVEEAPPQADEKPLDMHLEEPGKTRKVPPPAAPSKSRARKSSMWQLLFGRQKNNVEAGDDSDTPVHLTIVDERLASDFAYVDLSALNLNRKIGQTLSEALSRTIGGICIGRVSDKEITVACKDPSDVHIYDNIAIAATPDFRVNLVRADQKMVENALEFVFRSQYLGAETSWSVFLEQKHLDSEKMMMTSQSAPVNFDDEALEGPVVDTVDRIIKEAISAGASDIHLEPYESGLDVRYRIDGVLRRVNQVHNNLMSAVVKRIKVMGNLDIAQERQTQGGRISLKLGSREYDLRVSVIPVPLGESVVMRVLKKGAFTLTLSDLGFDKDREEQYRSLLNQPYGMILVCGPTGSGKSTTLYASLKEIARPDRKLLTVEDPIEYQMPGIMQVQVNRAPREEEKKLTFSRALREFLRQDPDVILVGEIRDKETAEIGIQAALTGHLLLSTIHTNDSIGIVSRLKDMDCEPFLISSVLLGGLAQRLARKLCPNCREETRVPGRYLPMFESAKIPDPGAYRSVGCRDCNQTGSRGRIGIYELLEITTEIRNHITNEDSEEMIRQTALAQGYRPLLTDGLQKVAQGLVSLEEVLRVCRTVGDSKGN
jgi:type II secretory ATPase GspE/PulE/Tfp pilus assembly ATPase PilB-like protein/serine/threonine protein kinase